MSRDFARRINLLGLIPRPAGVGLRLCHSREGGNPGSDIFSGHPPEFTPAEAEAGVTVVTLGQIPRSLLRGSSLASARWSNHFFCRAIRFREGNSQIDFFAALPFRNLKTDHLFLDP